MPVAERTHRPPVRSAADERPIGLSSEEAARRLLRFGRNELPSGGGVWPLWMLGSQFTSPLVLILIAAAGVSLRLGEWVDAAAIGTIVVLNGVLWFAQEWQAERTLEALAAMLKPTARVVRDGHEQTIPAAGVHLGVGTLWLFDRVLSETGDLATAQTAAFTGLVVIEKANVLNFRSARWTLVVKGLLSNPWLMAAIALTLGLQVAAVYAPPLQALLHTRPPSSDHWVMIATLALPVVLVPELVKAARSRRG